MQFSFAVRASLAVFSALTILGCLLCTVAARGESLSNDDGFDLFIEALRFQGSNPKVVHSGRFEIAVTQKSSALPEKDFQEGLKAYKHGLLQRLDSLPKGDKKNRSYAEQAIATAEVDYRKAQEALHNFTQMYKVIFRGVEPYGDVKQEIFDIKDGRPASSPTLFAVGGKRDLKTDTFIRQEAGRSNAFIEHNYSVPAIYTFGRARGRMCVVYTALLLLGTRDNCDYSFNQSTLNKFREINSAGIASGQKSLGIRLLGDESIAGGTASVIYVPPPREQKLVHMGYGATKIWVDPSRGYICPRIEEYSDGRLVRKYESDGYFKDENSGLWWPRTHVTIDYAPASGQEISKTKYAMEPSNVAVNVPVADHEFEFPIQKGVYITDRQRGGQRSFRATSDGSLRVVNGAVDLSNNPNILPFQKGSPPQNAAASSGWGAMLWFNIVVISLIALAIAYRRTR